MTRRQYGLLLFQFFCMAEFIIIDFFMPSYGAVSSILKFTVVWCAFLFAWPSITALPLCGTILCDYLLLFTSHYRVGVTLFAIVHLLYCYFSLLPCRRKLAALILLLLPIYSLVFLLPLPIVCLFYLLAFTLHFLAVKRLLAAKYQPHYLIALLLFAFCDLLTALHYLSGFSAIAQWIWIFYAPSQILLGAIMSQNDAICWPPVHIPVFRRQDKQNGI